MQERKKYDESRREAGDNKALHTTRWRKVRIIKIRRDPLCEVCGAAAVLVHHKDRDQENLADENLQSLCRLCHEKEHSAERFGRRPG